VGGNFVAQKVQVLLVDDLDGGEAVESVGFALDGVAYEIDLSVKNAAALRDAMSVYVAAGRRIGGRRKSRAGTARGTSPSDIREWARANGWKVSDRGRVPADVRAAYAAAH
jgi:Lsr2